MARDGGTGSRRRKRSKSIYAQGDTAAGKARIPTQAAARDVMDDVIQHGDKRRTAKQRIDRLGLSDVELRDLSSYSRARSNQSMDKVRDRTWGLLDEAVGLTTGVKPSDAWWSYTHPKDRLLGEGRAANQTDGPALSFFPFGRAGKAAENAVERARPAGSDEIMEALPRAKVKRREQEKLYHQERRERAAKVEEALKLGGEAGERAALAQLKGELPKLKLGDGLKDFDQGSFESLLTSIGENASLRPFEKVATQRALRRLVEGTVPTRSEIKLLERAFGPDLAAQIGESASFWQKAGNMGLSVINVPRAMMATLDLSAPFRQGLVLGARHPVMFARAFRPMLKSFKGESSYMDVMDEIASRPTFKKMEDARLQLTDFENLSTREEGFQSNLAETLTGGKRSPVRMSGRAYSAFLNKFRADAFDNYLRLADEQGLDIDDPKLLRDIASWVNHSTGRGSIKGLEGAMVPMTALFFSPRLIASRLQLLNPAYYARLDPFARKQALAGARNLLGAISMTLFMAKQAGADVSLDPRSSDFGKIKVGDTRVDIAGGLQQYVVNAYRVIKGETVSSTTGEVTELEGGFGKPSRWTIAGNFIENKLAPVPRFGLDFARNENFAGEPFDLKREGSRLFMPIGGVSTYEAYQHGGIKPAAATAGLGGIGFGVLTYGSQEKKSGGKGSSSKSIYGGGGGGGRKSKSIYGGG